MEHGLVTKVVTNIPQIGSTPRPSGLMPFINPRSLSSAPLHSDRYIPGPSSVSVSILHNCGSYKPRQALIPEANISLYSELGPCS